MATGTAFESITSRQAWYANEAISKYDAVMVDTDGKYAKADGTGLFAGICQYGADAAGIMVTTVRGIFPGVLSENAMAGSKLTIDGNNAGKFKIAGATDKIYGVLLYDVNAGDLAAINMVETGAIGIDTVVEVVTFSPVTGEEYTAGTTTITLSSATSGATIMYRVGTTGEFAAYTEAIATTGWTGEKTIQAYATKTGMTQSAVTSATYTAAA